jgi:hypothetical protein
MVNEGALAKRTREQGQVCCLCRIPLAPPHPMRERYCLKCGQPHRVYFHASHYGDLWYVQFLEEDLRTSFCGHLTYTTLDEVRALLQRLKTEERELERFECGLRPWGIGACFVILTPKQYVALKIKHPKRK